MNIMLKRVFFNRYSNMLGIILIHQVNHQIYHLKCIKEFRLFLNALGYFLGHRIFHLVIVNKLMKKLFLWFFSKQKKIKILEFLRNQIRKKGWKEMMMKFHKFQKISHQISHFQTQLTSVNNLIWFLNLELKQKLLKLMIPVIWTQVMHKMTSALFQDQ
jgi:hypothetical protein